MPSKTTKNRRPPAGLSPRSAALWRATHSDFDLSAAEIELLTEALRALDRADQARQVVDRDGPVVPDRYGSPKAHPAVDIEARARAFYAAAVRQLGVRESDPPPSRGPGTFTARRR